MKNKLPVHDEERENVVRLTPPPPPPKKVYRSITRINASLQKKVRHGASLKRKKDGPGQSLTKKKLTRVEFFELDLFIIKDICLTLPALSTCTKSK